MRLLDASLNIQDIQGHRRCLVSAFQHLLVHAAFIKYHIKYSAFCQFANCAYKSHCFLNQHAPIKPIFIASHTTFHVDSQSSYKCRSGLCCSCCIQISTDRTRFVHLGFEPQRSPRACAAQRPPRTTQRPALNSCTNHVK